MCYCDERCIITPVAAEVVTNPPETMEDYMHRCGKEHIEGLGLDKNSAKIMMVPRPLRTASAEERAGENPTAVMSSYFQPCAT